MVSIQPCGQDPFIWKNLYFFILPSLKKVCVLFGGMWNVRKYGDLQTQTIGVTNPQLLQYSCKPVTVAFKVAKAIFRGAIFIKCNREHNVSHNFSVYTF